MIALLRLLWTNLQQRWIERRIRRGDLVVDLAKINRPSSNIVWTE